MKKIFVLNGSRQKKGNTATFIKRITERLDKDVFEVEYAHPQDYKIAPCLGCSKCFLNTKCVSDDDLEKLQKKILESDVFIIASPVYMHYMTADLKLIIDKLSWWAHTLRLQGKPVVILSTCCSNGHGTVISPLSKFITHMGGNVIACSNAALDPDQLKNEEWMEKVSSEIASRIRKYAFIPHDSNEDIEMAFKYTRLGFLKYREQLMKDDSIPTYEEYEYWNNTGMINFDTFEDYLKEKYKCEEVVV
ncbi:flavodoxin family protein [Butyrivibrio sp. X503]|uniref:flavodoxin family protein n=1 Tax=Butyrivibrio sp. X503 TaxID=2364878 RepID=UPI000EA892F4|nr:flavodoxin family protein [Butyrivibrio sp. X503]RKM55304.1 flavodoxin family protein [Butyrivibrio sp. X503]